MVSGKNSGGEKWGKFWTHSSHHPRNYTSHHWPHHRTKEHVFIAITMFSRGLGTLREQRSPLREDSGERGGEPQGARWGAGWGTPGSQVGNNVEHGGEQRGGTPSDSRNGTKRKREAHTQGTQTAQGQCLPSPFTPHACHGRQARHQRHHQTPHDPHLTMPPHAHSCDSRNSGGRICVMVAQHSWCFVSVLRVP